MSRLQTIWNFIGRQKYAITIFFIIAIVGFVDDNSFWNRHKRNLEIEKLRAETDLYQQKYEDDTRRLQALEKHDNVERLAREKYLMKRDGEDVYIFVNSEDLSQETMDSLAYQKTKHEQ